MTTATCAVTYGYADDLFGFERFPDSVREASRFPIMVGSSEFVPPRDDGYVFRKEHLRVIQFWVTGAEKNLLLQGDTGTGKTTLIEQVANRLNWPTYIVGCHGDMEFQELIGRVTLMPDGSTGWADGPLIAAMRVGGIFLLDEINFLKNEVAGGLNTVLQAGSCLVPETGELVKIHPEFRIAATGNAINGVGKGGYRGTQTANIALLDRFTLGIHIDYMGPADEQKMLRAKAPGLDERVSKYLVELAKMSRLAFSSGALKAPLSSRATISSARRIRAFSGNLEGEDALRIQCRAVSEAFTMSFLFRWAPEERIAFMESANQVADRLLLPIKLE